MPKGDSVSSRKFYNALIGSAKNHGFDFVKIDNQNRQLAFYGRYVQSCGNSIATCPIA